MVSTGYIGAPSERSDRRSEVFVRRSEDSPVQSADVPTDHFPITLGINESQSPTFGPSTFAMSYLWAFYLWAFYLWAFVFEDFSTAAQEGGKPNISILGFLHISKSSKKSISYLLGK